MNAVLPLFLAFLVQDKPKNRSYYESFLLAKREALAWNKEPVLLKVAYTSELLFDVDPQSDRVSDLEFQFGGRDGCAPGEMKVRTWTLKSNEIVPTPGDEKTEKTGPGSLPEKVAPVKKAVDALRAQGMKFRPKMELAVLHGRALWMTTNGPKVPAGQTFYFADGVTGDFVTWTDATLSTLSFIRDQTFAMTTWKQAVDAVEKDLKAWKLSDPQLAGVKGAGKNRQYLDRELGIVDWEFQVFFEKPAPAMLFYRISNGNVALWAIDSAPADRSSLSPLSSWSFAGAGDRVPAHPSVKPFLASLPNVSTSLQIDAAHAKAGEAVLRITNLDDRSTLEVTLDKKGAVKGAAKK